jgi:hypothetical protein
VSVTEIGRLYPVLIVVDADDGRPVSVVGASWLYATDPVTVCEKRVPVGRSALHHIDLPRARLGIGGDQRGVSAQVVLVGVPSTAWTSMNPDSVTAGWRSDGENR